MSEALYYSCFLKKWGEGVKCICLQYHSVKVYHSKMLKIHQEDA